MGCKESNYSENPNIVFKDDSQVFKYHIIKEGCLICYIDNIPLYQIHFGKDLESLVESNQSTSHAAHLYYKHWLKISQMIILYKRKQALWTTSFWLAVASIQRKHVLSLGEQLQEFVEEEKENFFIQMIAFDRISQKAYRSLARLNESLIQAGAVYNMRQETIHRVNEKISISLVDIGQLTVFEPITEEADITDSTIVSNIVTSIGKDMAGMLAKKTKHVIITVALLNNLDKLHKPESYYILVLFSDRFYEIGRQHWNIELYFSSNWKFLAICLGMNATNSKYFCPWYYCNMENLTNTIEYSIISKNMKKIKESYSMLKSHIRPSF
ncbi:hypothetical protein C2G38_2198039 [Gigaspora rosea]|uniref:Uncharacterized protein n=1 Tax=Gigaspora rosea TaxID=44941 RepID=A0A397UU93_9GLOM|nr:hypothetical protein C2G38_2198039 [Gigaspora rosea]